MIEAFPKVLVSILNWNNFSSTHACVESVLALQYPHASILILDNASSDDSFAKLKKSFPDLIFLALSTNDGYAAAHFEAAKLAMSQGFDALWILNNDLLVHPKALLSLVQAWQRHGMAVYGSVSFEKNNQGTIDFGGGWELNKKGGLDYALPYNRFMGKTIAEAGESFKERFVSDVNGCSMLIPKAVIEKYGFMDPTFFLYKEETDYCFTLMENGIPSVLVADSHVFHALGGSFTNAKLKYFKTYYSERNLLLFMKKHPRYFVPFRNPIKKFRPAWLAFWKILACTLSGKKESHAYYQQLGILHGTLGIKGKIFKPEAYI